MVYTGLVCDSIVSNLMPYALGLRGDETPCCFNVGPPSATVAQH